MFKVTFKKFDDNYCENYNAKELESIIDNNGN